MDVLRDGFDGFYDLIKPVVFKLTKKNAKIAHKLFVGSLRGLRACRLSELVLDSSTNYIKGPCEISNAAGFVKDAEIDPRDMKLLGFDRVVVGTVTYDYNEGNSGQTIWRFPETKSLVNREGLPGVGEEGIARRLYGYGYHGVPLTISLMATPGKSGDALLYDLEKTALSFRDVPYVDRFELNISCPNIKRDGVRLKNVVSPGEMIDAVKGSIFSRQELYVKVSPDSSCLEHDKLIEIGERFGVDGYVTTNTTKRHDPKYITEELEEGGASGDAVWVASIGTQKYFAERVGDDVELIGCGGVRSAERMRERLSIGNCKEIQIFTPVIFEGTGLLRKLRGG